MSRNEKKKSKTPDTLSKCGPSQKKHMKQTHPWDGTIINSRPSHMGSRPSLGWPWTHSLFGWIAKLNWSASLLIKSGYLKCCKRELGRRRGSVFPAIGVCVWPDVIQVNLWHGKEIRRWCMESRGGKTFDRVLILSSHWNYFCVQVIDVAGRLGLCLVECDTSCGVKLFETLGTGQHINERREKW